MSESDSPSGLHLKTVPSGKFTALKRSVTRKANELEKLLKDADNYIDNEFTFPKDSHRSILAYIAEHNVRLVNLVDTLTKTAESLEQLRSAGYELVQDAVNQAELLQEWDKFLVERKVDTHLTDISDSMADLRKRLTELDVEKSVTQVDMAQEDRNARNTHLLNTTAPTVTTPTAPTSPNFTTQSQIRLSNSRFFAKELRIPEFHGEYSKYPAFLEIFNEMVGNNNSFSDLQKLSVLLGLCKGPAEKALEMIPRKGTHYKTAIEQLEKTFGNLTLQRDHILDQLTELPHSKHSTRSLLATLHSVQTIFKRFEDINEPIETCKFSLVRDMFPARVRAKVKLADYRSSGKTFGAKEFLQALETAVEEEMFVEQENDIRNTTTGSNSTTRSTSSQIESTGSKLQLAAGSATSSSSHSRSGAENAGAPGSIPPITEVQSSQLTSTTPSNQ